MRKLPGHAHKHGHSHDALNNRFEMTSTYRSWADMIKRCQNPKSKSWARYGGRGIKVCERWLDFRNFLADMGNRPTNKTLDRFPNNDGNYEPSNCRWASRSEQRLNASNVHLITFEGVTLPLKHWAKRIGIKRATLSNRILYHGWTIERALTTTAADGTAQRQSVFKTKSRDKNGRCTNKPL